MSVPYFGDIAEDATVYIPFNTFSSNDPQASVTITNLADADLHVHKDGSATQIVTDGATIEIDFDTITGNHLATIDTSAHADYSTGSDYMVRMEGTTVDGGTINAWIGSFSIENRFMRGTDGANTTVPDAAGTAPTATEIVDEWETQSQADPTGFHVNVLEVGGTGQTANDNGADINTILSRIIGTLASGTHNPATAAEIAVLSDWINGGRLDLLLDAIKVVTDAQAATGTGLTAIPWNADWDAEVQSEVNDALIVLGLDHLVAASVTGTDVIDNSIIAKLVSASATADWDDFVNTTDSLQAARDHIGDGTNLTEAGGDGDHLTESGGTGDQLTAINLPNQTMNITGNLSGSVGSVTGAVGSVAGNVDGSTASVTGAVGFVTGNVGGNVTGSVGSNLELGPAEVNAECDTALSDYDGPTNAEMEARTPTAAQLAYIVANSATGVPVTFTTSGGGTTAAVFALVDGAGANSGDDHYNGRLLVFNNGTLKDVVTDIIDYDGGTLTATITAIPFAPTASHTARLI